MTWTEIGSWTVVDYETLLSVNFTSRLIVKVSGVANLRPSWNWAGYFYQYLDIEPVGLTRIDRKINISTREAVLFVPEIFKPSYTLKFIRADWIDSLILTIYEDYMPLNFEPIVNVPSTSASSATSVTVPISTTSVSLLAANTNRKKLVIANNTNQDLYVDLDATAAVADHAIKIPRVSASGFIATYELEQYTGVVSGIWGAAGTGAALIREMI
ncbi:MAG: hypothetical protein ACRC2S_10545 [Waterburya sp.]